jgi:hypothetical protein
MLPCVQTYSAAHDFQSGTTVAATLDAGGPKCSMWTPRPRLLGFLAIGKPTEPSSLYDAARSRRSPELPWQRRLRLSLTGLRGTVLRALRLRHWHCSVRCVAVASESLAAHRGRTGRLPGLPRFMPRGICARGPGPPGGKGPALGKRQGSTILRL